MKILLILLFSSSLLGQTIRYISPDGDNSNGESWATAWTTFANAASGGVWTDVSGGGYIYIDGGADSTIYYETFTVEASGAPDDYIYIIAGKYSPSPSGHSGRVIIDGGLIQGYHTGSDNAAVLEDNTKSWATDELAGRTFHNSTDGAYGTISSNTETTITGALTAQGNGHGDEDWDTGDLYYIENRSNSIYMSSRNWIYVKGFEARKTGADAIRIYLNSNYIVIDSCKATEFLSTGISCTGDDDASLTEGGVNAEHIEVKNCFVESLTDNHTKSNDVTYFQMIGDLDFHDNYCHMQNYQLGYLNPNHFHSDPLQTNYARDLKVYNNVFITDSGAFGHSMILGAESRVGGLDTVIIYNNYFYNGGHVVQWPNVQMTYLRYYSYIERPAIFFYHNTIVGANNKTYGLYFETAADVRNNIMVQWGTNEGTPSYPTECWYGGYNSPQDIQVDSAKNNLIWSYYDGQLFGGNMFVGAGGSPTGSPSSWADWTDNYGGNGLNTNPAFTSNYYDMGERYAYRISDTSACVGAGVTDIQSFIESKGLPWTDIEGNTRESTPTIGAYEPSAATTDTTATVSFTPVTGAALGSYHTTYGILADADSTFWVLSSAATILSNLVC